MGSTDSLTEFNTILDEWVRQHGADPVTTINGLAELVEKETESYYKMDPDPFDDRHPGRANPTCTLGQLMKAMFRNEEFMNKLVGTYLMNSRDQRELHTAACRLLLDVMPGLETSVVFEETESLVRRLFQWAENEDEPLQSYATGLLAGAMEIQDIATNFKDQNSVIVPLMLRRLHNLRAQQLEEDAENQRKGEGKRNFATVANSHTLREEGLSRSLSPWSASGDTSLEVGSSLGVQTSGRDSSLDGSRKRCLSPESSPRAKRLRVAYSPGVAEGDLSNSSWADVQPYVIGSYSMCPLTTSMKQRLILQYLTPMGEYQELLSAAFENNAMELIFFYINLRQNSDVRLAFEALKYLATLLCHKKFAIEFLQEGGVQRLLEVYRPSIAATGVSLCLYYISYFEDALERVCLLPDHILSDLVGYVLWLLECSHDSSRCHAAMFFTQVFPFKVMLDLFDQRDGLRRLLNIISTLPIMNVDDQQDLSEDHIFVMQQATRHVCGALKRYFEAHLVLKAEEIRRSHLRTDTHSHLQETPAYKPLKLSPSVVQESVELLMELLPLRSHWLPEVTFVKLGGIQLLTQLVAMAPDWTSYPGKPETIKHALDILYFCTVTPKCQLMLLNLTPLPAQQKLPAISVVTTLAEGEQLADPEVQKSALNVLVNCVCGPVERLGGGVGRFMGTGSKKKINSKIGEDVLSRMWNGVRTNNGIMVLMKLLNVKLPMTDADAIRALACRALTGLSRSDTVRQIIGKLPLFNSGQLQILMKEPVLQDKHKEHIKFCKYASELLERVSGKQSNTFDATLDEIRRADIVAQTKIIFQEKELLQLIHEHLLSKGMIESAAALQREAGLPRCSTPSQLPVIHPHIYTSPATPKLGRQLSQPSTSTLPVHSTAVSSNKDSSPSNNPCTPGPIKFTLNRPAPTNSPQIFPTQKGPTPKNKFLREREAYQSPSIHIKSLPVSDHSVTLDKIVTEYLRKQHALCRNPVVTCPPMSLFKPHCCPEPRCRNSAPLSIASRINKRSVEPQFGGRHGSILNRRYIYSRFRPVRTYRDPEDYGYACCAFSADEKYLMLGTFSGDLKLSHLTSGEDAATYDCHTSPLIHLEPARDGRLIITSTWGSSADCSLWRMGDSMDSLFSMDVQFAEFSKLTQDRIIGTKNQTAYIYDVTTSQQLLKLYDKDKANNYKANAATFNPTDELVLNDGVLWDIRTPQPIHKFDKFNQYISGVFHPVGLEIIINSEVWDVRTFQLLRTVPALDQCQIKFNNNGDILYATRVDEELDNWDDRHHSQFGSTLRTFDAIDYSSIGTMDLKTKSIFHLSIDRSDCRLAIVENQKFSEGTGEESVCRLYEIGKLRDEDDDQQEEEEEEENVAAEEEDDDDNLSIFDLDSPDLLSDDNLDADDGDNEVANLIELSDADDDDDDDEEEDEEGEGEATNDDEGDSDSEDGDGDNADDNNDDLDDILFQLV